MMAKTRMSNTASRRSEPRRRGLLPSARTIHGLRRFEEFHISITTLVLRPRNQFALVSLAQPLPIGVRDQAHTHGSSHRQLEMSQVGTVRLPAVARPFSTSRLRPVEVARSGSTPPS